MKVFIEKEKMTKRVSAKNVAELLKKLNINPATVLVVRNGELVTESAKLSKSDEIKIVSVISGG